MIVFLIKCQFNYKGVINNFTCMLNKYQNFIKISKSQECSFYLAFNKQNQQKVLIKRIKQSSSWNDLLANKHLKYQSKQVFFMKKIEIFKDKGYFFIVYQKPNGSSFAQHDDIVKLQKPQFYTLFFYLVEAVQQMLKNIDGLYIYPEWIFAHRNQIKICHFQPFFPLQNQSNSVHVFMFDAQKKLMNPEYRMAQSNQIPFQKNKNIVFNLGLVAYNLVTGRALKKVQTKQLYQAQLKSLELNAEKRLEQCLKDQKISKLIYKMLKSNDEETVQFQQIFNTFKRKAIEHRPKDQFANSISIKMQKIKLQNPNSIKTLKKKKLYRPCCRTFQDQQLIEGQKVRSQQKKSNNNSLQKMPKTSKLKIKSLSKPKVLQIQAIKTNRHVSCFFPQLNSNRSKLILQNTNISRPTMFRSVDSIRHRIFD